MKLKLNVVFTVLISVLTILPFSPVLSQGAERGAGVRTVVIDPGHGGKDPGAVHSGFREKDIVLSVSLKLADLIRKNYPDVKVILTRDKDVFVELSTRANIANKAGADLFISVHVNSAKSTSATGTETFVLGADKTQANLELAMRENEVITLEEDYTTTYAGFMPGSAESYIIFSLMQYVYQEQSMKLSSLVQKHYNKGCSMPDRGSKQAGFLVLSRTTMPSVLTELGFLPNAEDRKTLTTDSGQNKLATALFNAFSEYKAGVEGNISPIVLTASTGTGRTTTPTTQTVTPRNERNIVYRVQVCISPRKLGMNGTVLKKYKGDKITEKEVGNLYKYYVGECLTYGEAVRKQTEIKKTTPDAFVVAFDNENTIPVSDARKLTDR